MYQAFLRKWISLMVFMLGSVSAFSTIIPVSSTQNQGAGSLREAITTAAELDTLDLRGLNGQIGLDSSLVIDKSLHLLGPGAGVLRLNGKGESRIFRILEGDSLVIEDLTLTQGNSFSDTLTPGGGAVFVRGVLVAKRCVFTENEARLGGAIHLSGFGGRITRLYLEDCALYRNRATLPTQALIQGGGAISGDNRGEGEARIWAEHCTFSQNEAGATGGAVYVISDPNSGGRARMELRSCTLAENQATQAGGIDNSLSDVGLIHNCLIAANEGSANFPNLFGAFSSGGFNLVENDAGTDWRNGAPLITDVVNQDALIGPLANNGSPLLTHALRCGSPAIDAGDDGVAPLLDLRGEGRVGQADIGTHERNESVDLAINNLQDEGLGSLRQALILACPGDTLSQAGLEGAILLKEPLEIVQDVVIEGNPLRPLRWRADGAFRILEIDSKVSCEISWLTLIGGKPDLFGGGAIRNLGKLTLRNLTIQDCQAESGGAIANYGSEGAAELALYNCTISGNEALFLDGGAIDNRPFSFGANVLLDHCTIARNIAGNKGGGLYNEVGGIVELRNTIVGENQAAEGNDAFGEFNSLGHNLFQDATVFGLNFPNNELLGAPAMLDDLGNYGGPTFTHRLQAGSLAIDAGSNEGAASVDQRGEARIFNATTDIGAYEFDPVTGVEEELSESVSWFPNPVPPGESLKMILPSSEPYRVQLLDLQGRILLTTSLQGSQQSISIPNLATGIYLLRWESAHDSQAKPIMIR